MLPTQPAEASASVLANPNLVTTLTAFQGGIYPDMRPFLSLRGTFDAAAYCEGRRRDDWPALIAVGDCLATWLDHRSLADVPLLLTLLPFLRDMVAAVAIHQRCPFLAAAVDLALVHPSIISHGMHQACVGGNVSMLRLFYPHLGRPWTFHDEGSVLHGRSVHVLSYLSAHGVLFTSESMDRAALYNCLHIVMWLHTHRTEGCTTDAMDYAAQAGHLEVVQFLHTHRTEGCTTNAMDWAASHGHLEVVQFLHQHRLEGCTTNAMDGAAGNGHLEIVQFLHRHRTEGCTTHAMDDAPIDTKDAHRVKFSK
ncbi:Aste57867_4514 [Aphanomyces stellatus]|uniref:Aste57867_4514 protein n=1 Tax=Aphanomyces stellatus TaxID=120398 RepID=A0A485KBV7_9STRA|nr:hypothetical protein As57867_004501 [Aphanomyces stellatus]VFT81624.1 Aste57867_4514 [Aphanomyces stellatus]